MGGWDGVNATMKDPESSPTSPNPSSESSSESYKERFFMARVRWLAERSALLAAGVSPAELDQLESEVGVEEAPDAPST